MDNMEYITKSARETKALAREFRNSLIQDEKSEIRDGENGTVIALSGDLGAGKTTFMQGLAEALGVTQRIVSPTFILMKRYELSDGMLFHLDMYRLPDNNQEEIENLGLADIWSNPKNIVVIEWAEKIKDSLPKDTRWIRFEYIGEDKRKIVFE